MAFIAAKCPECGGAIQLDDAKESGFCMYCGTKVFLKETLTQRVRVDGIQTLEGKLNNAEAYARLGEIEKSIALLTQITEDFTSDYRAWWKLAKLKYAYKFYYQNKDIGLIDEVTPSKEYQYYKILLEYSHDRNIDEEYKIYTSQIILNKENSDKKVKATLSGDFTYINHCYRYSDGFEVINNELYYWEFKTIDQKSKLVLSKVNTSKLNIVSIHEGIIKFKRYLVEYKMSDHVSEAYQIASKKYNDNKKEFRKRYSLAFGVIGTVIFLILLAVFGN